MTTAVSIFFMLALLATAGRVALRLVQDPSLVDYWILPFGSGRVMVSLARGLAFLTCFVCIVTPIIGLVALALGYDIQTR